MLWDNICGCLRYIFFTSIPSPFFPVAQGKCALVHLHSGGFMWVNCISCCNRMRRTRLWRMCWSYLGIIFTVRITWTLFRSTSAFASELAVENNPNHILWIELVKSTMQRYVIILLDKGYRMWTISAVRSKFSGWMQYWWLSWSRLWGWMSLTFWICFWVMFFRSIRTVVLISQFHVCQWTTGNHFRSTVATMLMQICCNFFASFIWKLWWTGCKLYWL